MKFENILQETLKVLRLSFPSNISYKYAFSRYTIITHLCSRVSPAVYTKSDDVTHLFLETTCSLLLLRFIMWILTNLLISSWSNHVQLYTESFLLRFSDTPNF